MRKRFAEYTQASQLLVFLVKVRIKVFAVVYKNSRREAAYK